ncbi:MAG: transporter substrate-binding domain-containing protein [Candidatus Limnocylindrales bacterium]
MSLRGRLSLLGVSAVLFAACSSGGGATTAPSIGPSVAPSAAGPGESALASVAPVAGGLLEKITKAGKLVVSTDPKYPPQSELKPDGTFEGFDIDVATEIAKRMGVTVEFQTPDWSAITAGAWGGRWDVSVGSMTITVDRLKVLDFSPPYYYTPAQMAASTKSGITTLDGLAGKMICSGEATTYDQWLNGKLDYGTGQDLGKPPAGIKTTTLPTDTDCADQWKAGRFDFDGWLTSQTVVDGAIKAGIPLVKVGDPVYYEPLAVAVDKGGPDDSDFLPLLKTIVDDMHADGTLAAMSQKWFGADFTIDTSK